MPQADRSRAARSPSSVCVGGMRMSTSATSGDVIANAREECLGVADLIDDLDARSRSSSSATPCADQLRIVCDHDPHRNSPRTVVPHPSGLSISETRRRAPPTGPACLQVPSRCQRRAPPTPSSDHRQRSAFFPSRSSRTVAPGRPRVLDDVGQCLRHQEVRSELDGIRQPILQLAPRRVTGSGVLPRECLPPPPRGPSSRSSVGWIPRRELTELCDRLLDLVLCP